MADHLFLCGLSQSQLSSYDGGRQLQLHGPKKNLRLRVDDIRRRLFEVEPDLLTDLAEIATYVFAAAASASAMAAGRNWWCCGVRCEAGPAKVPRVKPSDSAGGRQVADFVGWGTRIRT